MIVITNVELISYAVCLLLLC